MQSMFNPFMTNVFLQQKSRVRCVVCCGHTAGQFAAKLFHLVRLVLLLSDLTLLLLRSSIDDLVFSVFTSNFFRLSYKISLLKNQFVTSFFIRFL